MTGLTSSCMVVDELLLLLCSEGCSSAGSICVCCYNR